MESVRERVLALAEFAGADRAEAIRQSKALAEEVRGRPAAFALVAGSLAELVLRSAESSTAESWLAQGLAALPGAGSPELVAHLRRAEANVALALGRHETAMTSALDACQQAELSGLLPVQASCYQALGIVLSSAGMVEEALDAAFDARRASRSAGRPPNAGLENNIAINLMELGYHDRGWELADRCVARAAAEGRAGNQASALITRGECARKAGRLVDAENDYFAALELARPVGNVQTLQVLHLNLGMVQAAQRATEAADASFRRVERLLEERPSTWIGAVLAMERAILMPTGGAMALLTRARDTLDGISRFGEAAEAVQRLYQRARQAGDWENALLHHEDWTRRRDTLEAGRHRRRARATELRIEHEFAETPGPELPAELRELMREIEASGEGLRARNRALEVLATRDELTGLANRRAFDERVARELARGGDEALSLAVIDVDRFKGVNDTFGHAVGDAVLVRVAGLLSAERRVADLVARRGGDEFVMLLPQASVAAARLVAARIVEQTRREPWGELAPGLSVTLSIGVAQAERPDAAALFEAADVALYAAKAAGRDGVS